MKLPWREVSVGGGRPIQTSLTQDETETLRELATDRLVLEVGSAYGYSAVVTGRVAQHVFAVDPHSGHGAMPDSLLGMRANIAAYALQRKVSIVVAHSAPTLRALHAIGARFGLVFVDGDHRREAVEQDVLSAMQLLEPDGTLACHDYGEDTCAGVAEAIDRLLPLTSGARVVDTLWVWENR